MRNNNYIGLVIMLALFIAPQSLPAAYTMTPLSSGESSLRLAPGGSFNLDIIIMSDAADVHNSAIFWVTFSEAGLAYSGYSWNAPYQTGSAFDDSTPFLDHTPVILDEMTLSGVGYPEQVVDVELSNVVAGGNTFSEGALVSLSLAIPMEFSPGSVFITVVPDTIANGFDQISTTPGLTFELVVVPLPATLGLLSAPLLLIALGGLRTRFPNLVRA